ncbi:MAG: Hsp20/alpha crystallin family protein [Thermodesulfobacteriota bacterium]|nr:Hsp20/alpha crystallin family protein [Thermodesulfobacteriota bacterium]
MTDHNKDIQIKEKQEVSTPEQTTPGPWFTPAVDIFETDSAITLMADIPGVRSDDLNIDLNNDVLTLMGDIAPYENKDEEDVLIEYQVGRYFRRFSLSDTIDREKIEARLDNGVLHLTLPKAEKAKPRKIQVTT